jgi:tRNA threonylcarbamoyladenosine biosynthesis protein TsaE
LKPLSYHQEIQIASLEALSGFAANLASELRPGDVVALDGTLGAGKTTLVAALGRALGLRETTASPTFVLAHEYATGPYPILHADLYRLGPEGADSFVEDTLFDVIDAGRHLLLVEWAGYAPALAPVVTISIELTLPPEEPVTHPFRAEDAVEWLPETPRHLRIAANRTLSV